MNPSLDQNKTLITLNVYFIAAGLEAAACAGYLLYLPADTQRGYSLFRLGSVAALCLAFLAGFFLAYLTRRYPARVKALAERFSTESYLRWALTAAALLSLGGILFILMNPAWLRDLQPYYTHLKSAIPWTMLESYHARLQPVVIWITLLCAQTIAVILYLYWPLLWDAIQTDFARPKPRLVAAAAKAGALSLILLGVIKAVPFILLGDENRALRLTQEPSMLALDRWLWVGVIAVNILAAWLIQKKYPSTKTAGYPASFRLLFTLALAGAYLFLTVIVVYKCWFGGMAGWNVFYLSRDSSSYLTGYSPGSIRPPVYPLFIDLATRGTTFDHTAEGHPDHVAVNDNQDPLMRVTRAQKVLLLGASLIACLALMGLTNPPLAATFFLWLYDHFFFTQLTSYLLTEAVNQALVFLFLAVFFTFFSKRWKWLIPCAGALCAALFLTRPASIYGGVFLAVMLIAGFVWNRRGYWLPALIAILLAGGIVSLPVFYAYLKTGNLMPTPTFSLQLWAFGVEFAVPEDIPYMPDEFSRQLLTKVLAVKTDVDETVKAQYDDEIIQTWVMLSRNKFRSPISLVVDEVLPNGTDNEKEALKLKMSLALLKRHPIEYLQFGWKSFMIATGIQTRLNWPFGFWVTAAAILAAALYLKNKLGLIAVTLTLVHLAHMVIVSLFDLPQVRLVWDTEFLFIIAVFLLGWGLRVRMLHNP